MYVQDELSGTADSAAMTLDIPAVRDALGRLSDAGLIGSGCVSVMNFDSVRAAMGERWEARREQLWEHAERALLRDLGPSAVMAVAGDADLVVAQPGVDPLVALARALGALREILEHFLGEVRADDIRLQQVDTEVAGDFICRPVDTAALARMDASNPFAAHQGVLSTQEPVRSTFTAAAGGDLQVHYVTDDVVLLRTGAIVGARLRACVGDAGEADALSVRLHGMGARDASQVDLEVLRQVTAGAHRASAPAACVTPISYSTLARQRDRRRVQEALRTLAEILGTKPILEIRDLRCVPAGQVAEVVTLMRPVTAGVIGEVEADKVSIASVAGCGLNGLSIRTLADWPREPRLVDHFHALALLARRIAPLCTTRAPGAHQVPALFAAGFTHAWMPSAGAPAKGRDCPA